MKKYLFVIIVVLLLSCVWLAESLHSSMVECKRLRGNQESLMQEVRLYENKLGESAASVQRLQLTKSELERNYAAMCEEARNLGIKVKRLQALSQTATSTTVRVETIVRDSIVWRDRADTVSVFAWRDPPWVSVSGVIDHGNVSLDVQSVDTITQIVHRVPKRFLFFRFGTKAIRQEVVSKNPHTKVYYTEYIELVK